MRKYIQCYKIKIPTIENIEQFFVELILSIINRLLMNLYIKN